MVKLALAYETGVLPANLHFRTPNPSSEGLARGSLRVSPPLIGWVEDIILFNTTSNTCALHAWLGNGRRPFGHAHASVTFNYRGGAIVLHTGVST